MFVKFGSVCLSYELASYSGYFGSPLKRLGKSACVR